MLGDAFVVRRGCAGASRIGDTFGNALGIQSGDGAVAQVTESSWVSQQPFYNAAPRNRLVCTDKMEQTQ
jgi:hypothetical protein